MPLAIKPNFHQMKSSPNTAALFAEGLALHKAGRLTEAEKIYDRVLTNEPDHFDSLRLRGVIFHQRGNDAEAIHQINRALKVNPNSVFAHYNLGTFLNELRRFDEALSSYDRALALRPNYAEALCNRGITLYELRRYDEALDSLDRAITARPDHAEALSNRGLVLTALNRFEDALASFDRALAVRPDFTQALVNRANALRALKRFNEALANYDRAVTVQPDCAEAHFDGALCRMLTGDLDLGWEGYEWRWETKLAKHQKRHFTGPLWDGSSELAGQVILLHAEQGLGDTIQFCRYVPLVAERGARVILEVRPSLHALMHTLPGVAQIISRSDPRPHFDTHCPLLSLPRAFRTRLGTIPSSVPYLRADPRAAKDWNVRLGARPCPRIGLAWSGSPTHPNDRIRSIDLGALLPPLDLDATYVSLQREVRASDVTILRDRSDLLHFGDGLKDFADTAALISNLDLIIAVDTAVAHLAGALGKPVWILLPFIPDWRWLLDREDSPWYPTARLFRQNETRQWEHVIARVHGALRDFVSHQ
jgi:tetratricopeptide (TPR) repeat protein